MPSIRKTINLSKRILQDPLYKSVFKITREANRKKPQRHEVINYLLSKSNRAETFYLEIGVRNPDHNFNKVIADTKYSVDPGVEFADNPVDFKLTSDDFFEQLDQNKILSAAIKFDVIFIDGLHISTQVERDISNSLRYVTDEGFLVLHDCNPPTEYHAREDRTYTLSPALETWTGTTWKAFYKRRFDATVSCCCIDSDWGIGVISKKIYYPHLEHDINPFYEFAVLEQYRTESLNLIDFDNFRSTIESL